MHYFVRLYTLAAATLANLAFSSQWAEVLKHVSETVPVDWVTLGDPPVDTTIDLHFVLNPHHENALIGAPNEVSIPMRRICGTQLSEGQVAELVTPRPRVLELVTSWLDHHGLSSSSVSITHGSRWLTIIDMPVPQANKLLGASYQLYQQNGTDATKIVHTASYGLPAMLHKYVEKVVPMMCSASTSTQQGAPERRIFEGRAEAPSTGTTTVGITTSNPSETGSAAGSGGGCGNDKKL